MDVLRLVEPVHGRALPAGALVAVRRALDELRDSGAPATLVAMAERAAVGVWRLESAIRAGRGDEEWSIRSELRALAEEWDAHAAATA